MVRMDMVRTCARRLTKLALVAGLAALLAAWFRQRNDELDDIVPGSPGEASWPPLDASESAATQASTTPGGGTDTAQDTPASADTVISEPTDGGAAEAPQEAWTEPDADGGCPLSHPVKAKLRSGIYHVPEGLAYDRTNADRCYSSPEAAEADGYRASKM